MRSTRISTRSRRSWTEPEARDRSWLRSHAHDTWRIDPMKKCMKTKITNFKDMYLAELQELVSAEEQLMDVLQRLSQVAAHPELGQVLSHHRNETKTQHERLVGLLR